MDLQVQKELKEKKIEEKHLPLEVQSLAFEVSDVQALRGCRQEDKIKEIVPPIPLRPDSLHPGVVDGQRMAAAS